MNHKLENREDGLANCLICGGAEIDLPSLCPDKKLTQNEKNYISKHLVDYTKDEWV